MSTKTKNSQSSLEMLAQTTKQAGILLMTAAVTIGMVELPEHDRSKIVVPNQPAFAFNVPSGDDPGANPIRREREETGPHFISYGVNQRTPGRTGRA